MLMYDLVDVLLFLTSSFLIVLNSTSEGKLLLRRGTLGWIVSWGRELSRLTIQWWGERAHGEFCAKVGAVLEDITDQ